MGAISRRSALLCLACYALIGSAGYANFPGHVHANVLSNYNLDDLHSRVMAPSFLAILLTVLMSYPLNIFPCR
jgi:amino acid permease